MAYFGPALDPSLGEYGRNTSMHVRSHEHFIPAKFCKHPLSDSVVKAVYVFPYIYVGGSKSSETNHIPENGLILSDKMMISLIEASVLEGVNATPWLTDDVITC